MLTISQFYGKQIFWNKTERWYCFYIFTNLMSDLKKIAGFAYLLLHSICCNMLIWQKHMKKIQPQRHVLIFKKDYYNSLLQTVDNFPWYYAKTQQAVSTSLKVSCKVKSATTDQLSRYYIKVYSPSLHSKQIFYPCMIL